MLYRSQPDGARPLLTTAEVAVLFNVGWKTVSRWARDGRLSAIRTPGGQRRFDEGEVRELLRFGKPHAGELVVRPVSVEVPCRGLRAPE